MNYYEDDILMKKIIFNYLKPEFDKEDKLNQIDYRRYVYTYKYLKENLSDNLEKEYFVVEIAKYNNVRDFDIITYKILKDKLEVMLREAKIKKIFKK